MSVRVQTVTGPVPLEDLGPTVTHEHVFLDSRDGFRAMPETIAPDTLVTPGTRPQVDAHPLAVLDNLLLDDLDTAVEELSSARAAGLVTLVEATSLFTGRQPEKLAEASRRSGLQIVMGGPLS
jgi:phosphotriesterase-related protein